MMKLTTAFALALVTATAACAAPSEDEPATGTTSEALTTCQPTISAAAITKQIVSVEEPVTLTVELVTISPKPFRENVVGFTFPAGFIQQSLATTSCTDMGTSWKCRHQATVLATGAPSGTGNYSMTFAAQADAASGCASGATQRIDFSLTTESFGYYDVDGSGTAEN